MLPETPGEKKQGCWAVGWKAKNNVQYLHFETDSAGLHKFIAWNIMWLITGVALGNEPLLNILGEVGAHETPFQQSFATCLLEISSNQHSLP